MSDGVQLGLSQRCGVTTAHQEGAGIVTFPLPYFCLQYVLWGLCSGGFVVVPLPLASPFHLTEEETCWGAEDACATAQADALLRAVYSHNSLFQEMSQEQQNPQTEAKHRALQFRQHNKSIDKVNLTSACFHNGKTNCRELGLQNTVL